MKAYISKKDWEALHECRDFISNSLEGCTADFDTEEGKEVKETYDVMLDGLNRIMKKARKSV